MQFQSLGQEDPLEKMATHLSILAWRILWTEEAGGDDLEGCAERAIGIFGAPTLFCAIVFAINR